MKKIIKIGGLLLLTAFFAACNNDSTGISQPKSETSIKKDASDMDLALCFNYSKTNKRYQVEQNIDTLFWNDLPAADEELELNVKFTLTDTANNVKGKFVFIDENDDRKESEEVILASNTKTVNGTIKGKSQINARHVSFMIIAELEEETNGSKMLIAENGKGYSSSGNIFSVIPDEKGIKIKLADNVKVQQWQGGWIAVKDSKFRISINYIQEGRTEFIFPFTEKDKKTYVQLCASVKTSDSDAYNWKSEVNACVAGGGMNITEFFDYDALKKSTVDVTFNPETGFEGAYKISTTDIIKNTSEGYPIRSAKVDFNLILGEADWSHSYYIGNFGNVDLLDGNLNTINNFSCYRNISSEIWEEYDYKYNVYVTPDIKFADYPDTAFQLDFASIFSPVKFYNPNIQ